MEKRASPDVAHVFSVCKKRRFDLFPFWSDGEVKCNPSWNFFLIEATAVATDRIPTFLEIDLLNVTCVVNVH